MAAWVDATTGPPSLVSSEHSDDHLPTIPESSDEEETTDEAETRDEAETGDPRRALVAATLIIGSPLRYAYIWPQYRHT